MANKQIKPLYFEWAKFVYSKGCIWRKNYFDSFPFCRNLKLIKRRSPNKIETNPSRYFKNLNSKNYAFCLFIFFLRYFLPVQNATSVGVEFDWNNRVGSFCFNLPVWPFHYYLLFSLSLFRSLPRWSDHNLKCKLAILIRKLNDVQTEKRVCLQLKKKRNVIDHCKINWKQFFCRQNFLLFLFRDIIL